MHGKKEWQDKTNGSHPPVKRMPDAGGDGEVTRFKCCPCRMRDGAVDGCFRAMVLVCFDAQWVTRMEQEGDSGFV